jgi:hypothetical protein
MIKDCDGLAMMYYRGLPHPSKLYKSHCAKKESSLEYTPEVCKKAMANLMLSGSEKKVKEVHGERIMECFNQADLDRFLNKTILK